MTPTKVEEALARVANFVKMLKAKPIGCLHDEFYTIHFGTEWEASLRFSDLATLTAALAESERDAARYRWLRDSAHPDAESSGAAVMEQRFSDWGKPYFHHFSGHSLDAAIDAAMKDTDHAR